MTRPHFNRILLKLSGEALMGQGQFGIDPAAVDGLASEIAAAKAPRCSAAFRPIVQSLWNSFWQQWLEAGGWGPTLDRSGFNV